MVAYTAALRSLPSAPVVLQAVCISRDGVSTVSTHVTQFLHSEVRLSRHAEVRPLAVHARVATTTSATCEKQKDSSPLLSTSHALESEVGRQIGMASHRPDRVAAGSKLSRGEAIRYLPYLI